MGILPLSISLFGQRVSSAHPPPVARGHLTGQCGSGLSIPSQGKPASGTAHRQQLDHTLPPLLHGPWAPSPAPRGQVPPCRMASTHIFDFSVSPLGPSMMGTMETRWAPSVGLPSPAPPLPAAQRAGVRLQCCAPGLNKIRRVLGSGLEEPQRRSAKGKASKRTCVLGPRECVSTWGEGGRRLLD